MCAGGEWRHPTTSSWGQIVVSKEASFLSEEVLKSWSWMSCRTTSSPQVWMSLAGATVSSLASENISAPSQSSKYERLRLICAWNLMTNMSPKSKHVASPGWWKTSVHPGWILLSCSWYAKPSWGLQDTFPYLAANKICRELRVTTGVEHSGGLDIQSVNEL